jgi:malate dehydrogenase
MIKKVSVVGSLDLEDTRGILGFNAQLQAGSDLSLLAASDIVVITAGIARKEGMSRADLFKTNAAVVKDISRAIVQYAPKSIVIVVTNPLDAITYVAIKETGFSRNKVLGMGSSLDRSRMAGIVATAAGVEAAKIDGMVFGVHSNEMIVTPERIKVSDKALTEKFAPDMVAQLRQRVKMRGGEIVGLLKNRSAYFAPGLAACQLVEAIAKDTGEVLPVSILLEGEYGLKGICMGVPCRIDKSGVAEIIELELSDAEKTEILKAKKSFQELFS